MKYKEVLPLKPTVTVSIVYFNELQMLCTLSSNGDIFRSALSACSCCWYHVDTDHSSNYSWMNHSTVTCYSFFFFLYPGNACAILKRLSEFSCRRVCPETEPVQLLPFQLCFSSLWRLCLKAPSGPGDAWCHCWGCWREHPPPTLGTTAAGKKKTGQCNFKTDLFSCFLLFWVKAKCWIFSRYSVLRTMWPHQRILFWVCRGEINP